jgi:hypothetical protein
MVRDTRRDSGKLLRAIVANPGISFSKLFRYTQGPLWDSDYRKECLEWLKMLGKVRPEKYQGKRGPESTRYWPVDDATLPASDGDKLGAANAAIVEAQRQLEMALRHLGELQAVRAAEAPAVAA